MGIRFVANSVKRAISVLSGVLGTDGIIYLMERHHRHFPAIKVVSLIVEIRDTTNVLQNIQGYIIEPIIHSHRSI